MRTTLTIDDAVLAEFKRLAAETHLTLGKVIEDALREQISRRRDAAGTKPLDFPTFEGKGVQPGVDLNSNAALADQLDEADGVYERYRRGE